MMRAPRPSQHGSKRSGHGKKNTPQRTPTPEALTKIFNTAMVTSHVREQKTLASALFALSESSAFRSILAAVTQHALIQGISEKEASLELIQTFRELDRLWEQLLLEEGLAKMSEKGLKK